MAKNTTIVILQLFIIFTFAPLSYSEDVFLAIGSGSGDPGSTNRPISVTLDNTADRVKGMSFKICYKSNQPYLPVSKCEGIGRASELSCQYNNDVGCVMLMLISLGDDVILEGTGPILRFYYDVPSEAPPGELIDLKTNNIIVSSDIRMMQQGRKMFKPLTVAAENGRFLITGESDEEEEDEDSADSSDNSSKESMGDTSGNQLSAGGNRVNFSDGTIQPTTSSIQKTDPEILRSPSSSRRQASTRKATASTQANKRISPSGTTTIVPGSSGTRVIVSPESVTLTSGDLITLDPQTLDNGIVVPGEYSYELTPPSPIGSTVSDDGQFTAGINTSFEDIEETVKITDTTHENASTLVVIIVAGRELPPNECELSISPSSATLSSQDSLTFSAKNFGKKCSEGLYEWKVNSKIDSSINQQGIYKAGKNTAINPVLDIVMVTDTVNRVSTDVLITVEGVSSAPGNQQPSETTGRGAYPKLLIFVTLLTTVLGVMVIRKFKN